MIFYRNQLNGAEEEEKNWDKKQNEQNIIIIHVNFPNRHHLHAAGREMLWDINRIAFCCIRCKFNYCFVIKTEMREKNYGKLYENNKESSHCCFIVPICVWCVRDKWKRTEYTECSDYQWASNVLERTRTIRYNAHKNIFIKCISPVCAVFSSLHFAINSGDDEYFLWGRAKLNWIGSVTFFSFCTSNWC